MSAADQSSRLSGGKGRGVRQFAFDDSNGMGEAEDIRIGSLRPGRLLHEFPGGEVGNQHPPELLLHQLWRLAAQNGAVSTPAAEVDLDLVEDAFNFPALVVERGQLLGRRRSGLQ